jgi:hypothetical protein
MMQTKRVFISYLLFFNSFPSHMMHNFLVIVLFVSLLLSYGCSSNETHDPVLTQANQVHLEALDVHEAMELKLDSLQAREVGPPDPRLDSLATALTEWESRLIEVPGFEDQHDHEGHHHNHDSAPELTPDQMLAVQREFLKEIKVLEQSLRSFAQAP